MVYFTTFQLRTWDILFVWFNHILSALFPVYVWSGKSPSIYDPKHACFVWYPPNHAGVAALSLLPPLLGQCVEANIHMDRNISLALLRYFWKGSETFEEGVSESRTASPVFPYERDACLPPPPPCLTDTQAAFHPMQLFGKERCTYGDWGCPTFSAFPCSFM